MPVMAGWRIKTDSELTRKARYSKCKFTSAYSTYIVCHVHLHVSVTHMYTMYMYMLRLLYTRVHVHVLVQCTVFILIKRMLKKIITILTFA